ncbi:MAG: cytochrome c [Chloroflexi bacterium]|nr:cytochrome c [Chloroflexota bacterium]
MTSTKAEKRKERRAKRAVENKRVIAGKGILLVAVLALVIYMIFLGMKPAEPLASEQIIELGALTYAESCASCHGDQGQGHGLVASAPALDGSEHAWHHPDGQIQEIVISGGQLMPPFGDQLSDSEIVAVIRFIQTWWSADQLASQQNASAANPLNQ